MPGKRLFLSSIKRSTYRKRRRQQRDAIHVELLAAEETDSASETDTWVQVSDDYFNSPSESYSVSQACQTDNTVTTSDEHLSCLQQWTSDSGEPDFVNNFIGICMVLYYENKSMIFTRVILIVIHIIEIGLWTS